MHFNNWEKEKLILKTDIKHLEFLKANNYIEELEDEIYFLTADIKSIEDHFYSTENLRLQQSLQISNVSTELNAFIKKLNLYNELKDAADSLLGKIAEIKQLPLKTVHEQLNIH